VKSNFVDDSETNQKPMPMSCPLDFDDDFDSLPPVPALTRSHSIRTHSIRTHINQPEPLDDIKYTITQDDDSAYASLSVVKMMREVSIGPKLELKTESDLKTSSVTSSDLKSMGGRGLGY